MFNNVDHHSSKGIEVIQQTALRQMPDSRIFTGPGYTLLQPGWCCSGKL